MGRYTVYAFQLVLNAEMKIQALLPHERMFYVLKCSVRWVLHLPIYASQKALYFLETISLGCNDLAPPTSYH